MTRRKKLIVDGAIIISGQEMTNQMKDTSDITLKFNENLAPPTKKIMRWKETGGIEKLFAQPGHPIVSKTLYRGFTRHLSIQFSYDDRELNVQERYSKQSEKGIPEILKMKQEITELATNESSDKEPTISILTYSSVNVKKEPSDVSKS